MADPTPLFAQVTVLAPGLLGASVLMAAKAHGATGRTAVWARREETRRECAAQPWCDQVYATPEQAVAQADLVVLCPPVEHIVPLLEQIAPHLKPGAIVTDVGSTKERICQAAAQVTLPQGCAFIGSHPMAGSEKTGLAHGRADLFQQRTCLVIPPHKDADACRQTDARTLFGDATADTHATARASTAGAADSTDAAHAASTANATGAANTPDTTNAANAAFEKTCAFWQQLGMRVLTPDARTHDQLVAEVSHLPHLLASTLCAWIDRDDKADSRRAASGSGLRDTTRIAAGDPQLWLSIARENREEIIRSMEGYIDAAQVVLSALKNHQDEALLQLLQRGKASRDKLDRS